MNRIKQAFNSNETQIGAITMLTILNGCAYLSGMREFSIIAFICVLLMWPVIAFIFNLVDPLK